MAAVALKKIGYDASNVSVGWCWVNLDAEDRLLWMLLTGKLWEILAYVTLPVLYILIRKHINRAVSTLLPDPSPCSAFLVPCAGRSCLRTLRCAQPWEGRALTQQHHHTLTAPAGCKSPLKTSRGCGMLMREMLQ